LGQNLSVQDDESLRLTNRAFLEDIRLEKLAKDQTRLFLFSTSMAKANF
jgi:hypothetical protein